MFRKLDSHNLNQDRGHDFMETANPKLNLIIFTSMENTQTQWAMFVHITRLKWTLTMVLWAEN